MTTPRLKQTPATTTLATVPAVGARPTLKVLINARAKQPGTQVRVTAQDVQDPIRLAKVLTDMQQATQQSTRSARTNPLNAGGVVLQSVSFVGGVTKVLTHNMGRPFTGYLLTRTYSATGAMILKDGVLPQGLTTSQALAVIATQTGVVDVLVF